MAAFCFARSRLFEVGRVLVRFDDVPAVSSHSPSRRRMGIEVFRACNRIAKNGAPERIRTTNLLIRSQMLYPVELRAPERESVNLRSNDRTVKSCWKKNTTALKIRIDSANAGVMEVSRTASVLQFKLTKPESSGRRSPKTNHVCSFAKQRNRRNHYDQAKPESS